MRVGLTVELLSPVGSVSFQSQIDVSQESVRFVRKDLEPGATWSWRLNVPRESIAVLAMQSMKAALVRIGEDEFLLEGQGTTDFGVIFARRHNEDFGSLPFYGDLTTITVTNQSDHKNRIDIFLAERPEQIEPTDSTEEE